MRTDWNRFITTPFHKGQVAGLFKRHCSKRMPLFLKADKADLLYMIAAGYPTNTY